MVHSNNVFVSGSPGSLLIILNFAEYFENIDLRLHCIDFFSSYFVFTWTRARVHCSWRCHRCCEQVKGRKKPDRTIHQGCSIMFTFWHRKKSIPLLVRQGVQTRRFLTATGRQVQSITPPANQRSDTCSCKKVHRRLVFNQVRSNLSIKERKKERNNNKKEWVGGWGAELPTTSCQMSRFKRSLFADRFLVHLLSTRYTTVALLLIGVAALNHTVSRWIWQWTVGPESQDGRSQLSPPSLPPSHPPCFFFPLAHLLARCRGGVKVVLMSEQRSRPPHWRLRWE